MGKSDLLVSMAHGIYQKLGAGDSTGLRFGTGKIRELFVDLLFSCALVCTLAGLFCFAFCFLYSFFFVFACDLFIWEGRGFVHTTRACEMMGNREWGVIYVHAYATGNGVNGLLLFFLRLVLMVPSSSSLAFLLMHSAHALF